VRDCAVLMPKLSLFPAVMGPPVAREIMGAWWNEKTEGCRRLPPRLGQTPAARASIPGPWPKGIRHTLDLFWGRFCYTGGEGNNQ
jgi:hypothetical protein